MTFFLNYGILSLACFWLSVHCMETPIPSVLIILGSICNLQISSISFKNRGVERDQLVLLIANKELLASACMHVKNVDN